MKLTKPDEKFAMETRRSKKFKENEGRVVDLMYNENLDRAIRDIEGEKLRRRRRRRRYLKVQTEDLVVEAPPQNRCDEEGGG